MPNSSFSKIVDYTEDFVRIKIAAPPVDNRANKELTEFCADLFDTNKSKIKIISGEKSKLKKILIVNADINDITQKLMFVLNSVQKVKKTTPCLSVVINPIIKLPLISVLNKNGIYKTEQAV